MKLHCFKCNRLLRGRIWKNNRHYAVKVPVWRDINNWPVCEDCFDEFLSDYYTEGIANAKYIIERDFNRSFVKYHKDITSFECPNCSTEIETPINTTDEFSCPECYEWLIVKEGKLIDHRRREDEV